MKETDTEQRKSSTLEADLRALINMLAKSGGAK